MTTDLQAIKTAIARVTVGATARPSSAGTGFYVGDGYVVSALHVVADRGKEPPLWLEGPIALNFTEVQHETTATAVWWDGENDWVVLRCDVPPPVAPLRRRAAPEKDTAWECFGYPQFNPTGGITIGGDIRDPCVKRKDEPTGQEVTCLQLFCRETAGVGPGLEGYSGAPCLVGGEVVGLLRATSVVEMLDGQQRPKIMAAGGTVFACPASAIAPRSAGSASVMLPATWASPLAVEDFLVVLSRAERDAELTLESVAREAHRHLKDEGLSPPAFLWAEEAVSTEETLLHVVRSLCRARVIVFDATSFDPAVMFLVGIRAVVRRGVTILSIGGDYALGTPLDIPFNIQDANIVSHSTEQDQPGAINPVDLLTMRIRRGIREIGSPFYLDLSVFDAIRTLPEERRGVRPTNSGVLVLCPFSSGYTKLNWEKRLKPALENEWKLLRKDVQPSPDDLGVARSFELNSPRLVTHAIYEEIRRVQACVVDLTEWAPSVLFELGARLAVSWHPTVCIVDSRAQVPRPEWQTQCERLLALLVPDDFRYDSSKRWQSAKAPYERAYGRDSVLPSKGPCGGSVYALIEMELDLDSQPASRPVYRDLIDDAKLFARPPGSNPKPVGPYSGNRELARRERQADRERLLAAWFYLSHRFAKDDILQDATALRPAAREVARDLLERHHDAFDELPQLRQDLEEMLGSIDEREGTYATKLERLKALKREATALRNLGRLDKALEMLDQAVMGMETLAREAGLDERAARKVRAEMADTLGMKGGVYRRLEQPAAALEEYEKGASIEEEIGGSTYNLGNTISLSITVGTATPEDEKLRQRIETVVDELKRDTQGARNDEWWALSDLGQLYLLQGKTEDAHGCYERGLKTGPTSGEIERHVSTLRELARATAQSAPPISQALEQAAAQLVARAAGS